MSDIKSSSRRVSPYKVVKHFSDNTHVRSITRYDVNHQRHGQKMSWWDKNHRIPKTLSTYEHGTLVNCTKWNLNGSLSYTLYITNKKRIINSYYRNGNARFIKEYLFIENRWVLHGVSTGFYKNKNRMYIEYYDKGNMDRLCMYFYYNGKIKSVSQYVSGKLMGKKTYDINETSNPFTPNSTPPTTPESSPLPTKSNAQKRDSTPPRDSSKPPVRIDSTFTSPHKPAMKRIQSTLTSSSPKPPVTIDSTTNTTPPKPIVRIDSTTNTTPPKPPIKRIESCDSMEDYIQTEKIFDEVSEEMELELQEALFNSCKVKTI